MKPRTPRTIARKAADAAFLADNFAVPTPRAADAVSEEDGDAAEVEARLRKRDARDPLAKAPVPRAPGKDRVADADEVRLKPVIRRNDRYDPSGR
jgi:hypothetical protein